MFDEVVLPHRYWGCNNFFHYESLKRPKKFQCAKMPRTIEKIKSDIS
jgi:hypothetical protein